MTAVRHMATIAGRYEITAKLGEGGMGVVFRAYDPPPLDREVAVKTLHEFADPLALELFYKECSALKSISHPNIVEIFDMGEFDDGGQRKPFFVMPLLPGADARPTDQARQPSPDHRSRRRDLRADVPRPAGGARARARASRSKAEQHLRDGRRLGEDHRLRRRAHRVRTVADDGLRQGHLAVYGARAGAAQAGVGPVRYLLARGDALRSADPAPTIPRRDRRRGHPGDPDADPSAGLGPQSRRQPGHQPRRAQGDGQAAVEPGSIRRASSATRCRRRRGTSPSRSFDPSRTQPRIQTATKALERGDYQFAGEIVGELEAEGNIDPQITLLRTQIDQISRQRTIAQLLDSAKARYEEDEDPLALSKLQEVFNLDPTNVLALSLKSKIDDRRSDRQIEKWIQLAQQHVNNHSYGHAREALQNALDPPPEGLARLEAAEGDRARGAGVRASCGRRKSRSTRRR